MPEHERPAAAGSASRSPPVTITGMPFTSRRAFLKALDDAHLTDVVLSSTATFPVRVAADGTVHGRWSSCLPRAGHRTPDDQRDVTAHQALEGPECRACARTLTDSCQDHQVSVILNAHIDAAAARRMADRAPGKANPAGAAKLLRKLANHVSTLEFSGRSLAPGLADPVALALQATRDAQTRLAGAARDDDAQREALTTAHNALVPARWRGKVHLPDEQCLIGLMPAMRGTDITRAILNAFAVPGASGQLLLAPRYVADYLNREMYRSGENVIVFAVATADATEQELAATAALWDPTSAGPLADLAVALRTARDVAAT